MGAPFTPPKRGEEMPVLSGTIANDIARRAAVTLAETLIQMHQDGGRVLVESRGIAVPLGSMSKSLMVGLNHQIPENTEVASANGYACILAQLEVLIQVASLCVAAATVEVFGEEG